MHRVAFRMQLHKGFEKEYEKRHKEIWPELISLLTETGINEYSIFLDENTGHLFGLMKLSDKSMLENLPSNPVMQKWWHYMKDIMDTHADHSPVSVPLREVFYMT